MIFIVVIVTFIYGLLVGSLMIPYISVSKIKKESFKKGVESSFHLSRRHYEKLFKTKVDVERIETNERYGTLGITSQVSYNTGD